MAAYRLSSSSILGCGMEIHFTVAERLARYIPLVSGLKCDTTFEHLMSFLRLNSVSIVAALFNI